jgi:S-DNA-T family DNA segregation ATPase FtsK/SpoIIIE
MLVLAMLVVAVRLCRGQRVIKNFVEVAGSTALFMSIAILLHLPFSDGQVTSHGPGGLLGQWLGQLLASFVGGVGAALAAGTILSIALLLLTNVRAAEVFTVVDWAARHAGRALSWAGHRLADMAVAAARALGRVVVAMFPDKDEAAEDREQPLLAEAEENEENNDREEHEERIETRDREDEREDAREIERDIPVVAASAPPTAKLREEESEPAVLAAAVIREPIESLELSEPVESAAHSAPVEHESDPDARRFMAAMVAEVAAVECVAAAQPEPVVEARPEPVIAAAVAAPLEEGATERNEPAAAKGPIIVQPMIRPAEPAEKPAEPDNGPGFVRLSEGAFKLPPPELLEYKPPKGGSADEATLKELAARLEQAMANYGVKGNVTAIQMGPVITTFEYAPAPGTRTGKIVQLENDLAMALEAQSVRIVAPIPGKAVVGIEIPSKDREMVFLKEILLDEGFRRASSKLQICMGKDTKGTPVSVNLAKMPHLLVAGTTGSGKSVAVNGMITSILYSANPEEVRFIMVDPKMLELSIYEGIPHLLLPVVTDAKKAALALQWAVDEMERRYELLAESGVRDIASYNAKLEMDNAAKADMVAAMQAEVAELRGEASPHKRLKVVIADEDGVEHEAEVDAEAEPMSSTSAPINEELAEELSNKAAALQAAKSEQPARKLPYIVIVIDEFADLMMVAAKDVETAVARLAQKARAAGLHLILATQRPSVDVITGLIKANFPSRIALQVASQIDSRTCLGQPGAETLLGNGDMLFSDRGTKLRRIQGAFLSDDEVHRVVDFLKKQAKPVYDMNILKPREPEGDGEDGPREEFHDELYDKAVAFVCESRQASVSSIQRRLQIGYNRAARMVEQMERDGLVGPANGIKPREVLAPTGDYLNAP